MIRLLLILSMAGAARAADDFASMVAPFLKENCARCHGVEKQKGKVTLHNIGGDFGSPHELERWELVLDVLSRGEMPPEDEPQPAEAGRSAVAAWIEAGLRGAVEREKAPNEAPLARRLTNFEYQNTLRDLLGFELKVADNLPEDPVEPYAFNNTAGLMLLGPEQLDRYVENARRAMASAIVDAEPPEVHKTRVEWKAHGVDRGLGGDEIGVWGNRRNTPATGMGLRGFPKTGEFRVRVKASAILPKGVTQLPLRLVMGYGLNRNSSMLQVEPIGTVVLRNSPDDSVVSEFRGRIENFPVETKRAHRGKSLPDSMVITPQNLYDDGTLNDDNDFSRTRNISMPRAVVEWMEFEAPIVEPWPPAHHTRILFESSLRESDPPAYVRAVLKRFISRAYRRPAAKEEIDNFEKIYQLLAPEMNSFEAAIRETLAMVLVSPQFLMQTVADGELVTAPYGMASRLSYFLWGSMPDDELLRLAGEGSLGDPAVVAVQARRLLADERSRDFVRNFTVQWLSLDKMKTVPINRDLFPRFLYYVPRGERAGTEVPYRPTIRDHMMDETVGFVGELIRDNLSGLNVVDSGFAYLNQPLAAHYGVDGVEGLNFRRVPVNPEHRLGGLFTQGSVLIGNGTGSAPHPIYRAVWLREAILGDEVKPPPAEVPALTDTAGESAETALTIKDLLAQHRQKESCNDCHVRLDPWGIPFERYNAVGQFQAKVPVEGTRVRAFSRKDHGDLHGYKAYLESIGTVPVEADARVPNGPQVDGMAELKAYLLKTREHEIVDNLVRRLLAYGLGRELDFRDRFAVEAMRKEAEGGGYKMQDLIVAICQSELFRNPR